jgi:hypothetical protein
MNLEHFIGLGVAGNFTGHLEQAGEASDFVDVEVKDVAAPKGIFPFYAPGDGEHFLHQYPISSDTIRSTGAEENLQIEPEVALLCTLEYDGERVARVVPTHFAAHNDCSIRRPGAKKISEKKNWGACSKGTSSGMIEIDRFTPGGVLDHFRIASYLERDGELHPYGVDSAVASYSYFHQQLLDWLVDRMNEQEDAGPLESISGWLVSSGRPRDALISVGATRYTDYGEQTFLSDGDEAIVAVYDSRELDEDTLRRQLASKSVESSPHLSLLRQRVA